MKWILHVFAAASLSLSPFASLAFTLPTPQPPIAPVILEKQDLLSALATGAARLSAENDLKESIAQVSQTGAQDPESIQKIKKILNTPLTESGILARHANRAKSTDTMSLAHWNRLIELLKERAPEVALSLLKIEKSLKFKNPILAIAATSLTNLEPVEENAEEPTEFRAYLLEMSCEKTLLNTFGNQALWISEPAHLNDLPFSLQRDYILSVAIRERSDKPLDPSNVPARQKLLDDLVDSDENVESAAISQLSSLTP